MGWLMSLRLRSASETELTGTKTMLAEIAEEKADQNGDSNNKRTLRS